MCDEHAGLCIAGLSALEEPSCAFPWYPGCEDGIACTLGPSFHPEDVLLAEDLLRHPLGWVHLSSPCQ